MIIHILLIYIIIIHVWQPTPVFMPGKSHGQGSLWGYSPWGHKELDTTEHLRTHTQCCNIIMCYNNNSFPGGSDGKESSCNAGNRGSIPGSVRSPGEWTGYPFQYSYLENSMDRGAWWAKGDRVTESDRTE